MARGKWHSIFYHFTKADKLRPKAIQDHVEAYKTIYARNLGRLCLNYFITSSSKDIGKEEVLEYIDELNTI